MAPYALFAVDYIKRCDVLPLLAIPAPRRRKQNGQAAYYGPVLGYAYVLGAFVSDDSVRLQLPRDKLRTEARHMEADITVRRLLLCYIVSISVAYWYCALSIY